MDTEYLLEVRDIEKSFPGAKALDGVKFSLKKGEIHALVGENGAGKSTLMNIIDGVLKQDAGEILINGERVDINSPLDAQKLGIGFIHQEIALCPDVSVAENILMPQIAMSRKPTVDYGELYERSKILLRPLADIDPRARIDDLTVSSQQIVEIAKALSLDCKILILDEPTSSLSEHETEALFRIMRRLKEQGIGIIYISHRMAEVFDQCDRVTILRDGKYVDTFGIDEVDPETVVGKMVGRDIYNMYPPKRDANQPPGDVILDVRGIGDDESFRNISFQLRRGEVLGFAGLIGAGRSEVAKAICGFTPLTGGDIHFQGKRLHVRSPREALNRGIAYLTEDRKAEGLFLDMEIRKNISVINLRSVAPRSLIRDKMESDLGKAYIRKMNVKCSGGTNLVSSLSGGNQQKVLISKLLTIKPKLIFMDEPTRGIDVGAKYEIHKLIRSLADEGTGIVVISSELPEVVGMCDRVVVLCEGEKTGEVSGPNITEKNIIHLASGITNTESVQGA